MKIYLYFIKLSKKDQCIKNIGTGRHPVWVLNKLEILDKL